MPFPLRTVAPLRLCRLEEPGAGAGAAAGTGTAEGAAGPLFGCLQQVSAHALGSVLWQLSDLSRCAGDIFGGIAGQADALCRRGARLQRRLRALQALGARLDHRRLPVLCLVWNGHHGWFSQEIHRNLGLEGTLKTAGVK